MTKEQLDKKFTELRKHYEDLDFVKDFVEKSALVERIEGFISRVNAQAERGCYPSFIFFVNRLVESSQNSGHIIAENIPFAYFASDEAQVDSDLARSEMVGHLLNIVNRFEERGLKSLAQNSIKFYVYHQDSDEIEVDSPEAPDEAPLSVDLFVAKLLAYDPYVHVTKDGTTVSFCRIAKDFEANDRRCVEYLESLSLEEIEQGKALVKRLKDNGLV